MASNYVLLERIELNASAASVTFSSIPQTGYTDLKVVMSVRGTAAQILLKIQPNGDTTGLSRRSLYTDDGTGAYSASGSDAFGGYINSSAYTASTFASLDAYFPNYTSSTAKSYSVDVAGENNATATIMGMVAGLDTTTSPITSLLFAPNSGNFAQYSTFSLYGLAALGTTPVIAPKASGGNVIATDGTYWYHAFNASGTFTPATGLTCDVLVAAGGGGGGSGGGGSNDGAGGGAGGLRNLTSQSLVAQSYTITVGAGGTSGSGARGGSGVNSSITGTSFTTITSSGGGGGGNCLSLNGISGGSGGGAAATGAVSGTVGAGNAGSFSPVEGFAGGLGLSNGTSFDNAGGGGGSGAVGVAATSAGGGAGGAGLNTYSAYASATTTGVSGFYAGGGGGAGFSTLTAGAGGSGGGGAGSNGNGNNATAGTANTGSAGGGGGINGIGGTGGSGLIIIRYTIA